MEGFAVNVQFLENKMEKVQQGHIFYLLWGWKYAKWVWGPTYS